MDKYVGSTRVHLIGDESWGGYPGLVLFRRGDVDHRMWYCRMKIPKADRYKTISLKTTDIDVARERTFDQDADIRFRLKHDVPVFNHPFREAGREYLLTQEASGR